jgi:hypothetical protein
VILITHSRSTLTFGKDGNYEYAKSFQSTAGPSLNFNSLETQIKGGYSTFHCYRVPSNRTRTARPTDISKTKEFGFVRLLYAQVTRVLGEFMSSGTACGLCLGAPGFCRSEQRISAVCRRFTQFLVQVPENTPRVLHSPHCQFLFTNYHAAAIYFLTVPLNKPQLINAI